MSNYWAVPFCETDMKEFVFEGKSSLNKVCHVFQIILQFYSDIELNFIIFNLIYFYFFLLVNGGIW